MLSTTYLMASPPPSVILDAGVTVPCRRNLDAAGGVCSACIKHRLCLREVQKNSSAPL